MYTYTSIFMCTSSKWHTFNDHESVDPQGNNVPAMIVISLVAWWDTINHNSPIQPGCNWLTLWLVETGGGSWIAKENRSNAISAGLKYVRNKWNVPNMLNVSFCFQYASMIFGVLSWNKCCVVLVWMMGKNMTATNHVTNDSKSLSCWDKQLYRNCHGQSLYNHTNYQSIHEFHNRLGQKTVLAGAKSCKMPLQLMISASLSLTKGALMLPQKEQNQFSWLPNTHLL